MAKPTNTTNTNVLDIDLKGYRQTLQNKGKPRILIEGLSNAFDTKSTVVVVTFSQKDGWADLVIKDNDPDGFANLRDAYTLFAASNRREDLRPVDDSARERRNWSPSQSTAAC